MNDTLSMFVKIHPLSGQHHMQHDDNTLTNDKRTSHWILHLCFCRTEAEWFMAYGNIILVLFLQRQNLP